MGRSPGAEQVARAAEIAAQIEPAALAREQRLEVIDALEPLLPNGLRRGSTISVHGTGATSLALATAAGASAAGSWVAAVGFPSLGLVAADELGIDLGRFAMVAAPDAASWATVVAALVDAFEVVLVRANHRIAPGDASRLLARARERGAVLLQVGGSAWPDKAETRLEVTEVHWEGLGDGHGHLRARRVTVTSGGRREAVRPRTAELWLPSADGHVEPALPAPVHLFAPGSREDSRREPVRNLTSSGAPEPGEDPRREPVHNLTSSGERSA